MHSLLQWNSWPELFSGSHRYEAPYDTWTGCSTSLDLYAGLFKDQTQILLLGCCELLKPESGCAMDVRLQAIHGRPLSVCRLAGWQSLQLLSSHGKPCMRACMCVCGRAGACLRAHALACTCACVVPVSALVYVSEKGGRSSQCLCTASSCNSQYNRSASGMSLPMSLQGHLMHAAAAQLT